MLREAFCHPTLSSVKKTVSIRASPATKLKEPRGLFWPSNCKESLMFSAKAVPLFLV